jgi:exodeoxyribonuclease VII small subunit
VTATPAAGDDLSELSYEAARDALNEVVARLEAGGLSLEESLQLWERGERLADHCQRWLDGARERVAAALSRAESDNAESDNAESDNADDG